MAIPALSIGIGAKFPAKIQGSGGISVTRTGGVVTIDGAGVRPPATEEEAVEGIDNTKTMTPLRVEQSVVANGKDALLTGMLPFPGYIARSVLEKLSELVSVKDFGAVGDGTADDTAAIQAAVDGVASVGRGAVHFPAGFYKTTEAIEVTSASIAIWGDGASVTAVLPSDPEQHGFLFGGTTFDSSLRGVRVRYDGVGTPTAGAGVFCTDGVGAISISNCRIEKMHRGVDTYNPDDSYVSGFLRITDCDIAGCVDRGIRINGISQFFFSGTPIYGASGGGGAGDVGLEIIAGGAFHIVNCTCTGLDYGIIIKAGPGQVIYDVFATNCEVDTCYVQGWAFDGTDGQVSTVKIGQSRAGYCTDHGFLFNGSGLKDVTLSACTAQKNGENGFFIAGGNRIELIGCAASNNSSLGSGSFGIKIAGGQDISVRGGSSGVFKSESATQDYALLIDAAFSGALTVDGFNARAGWTIGALANFSSSTAVTVINCAGINPRGMTYPTVGASPWSHRCGVSPESVMLNGGTVSAIAIDGVGVSFGAGYVPVMLAPGQLLQVTYSVAPNAAINAM